MFKIKKRNIIIFIIVAIAILVVAGAFFVFGKEKKIEYSTVIAEKKQLIQTVSEVGIIKSASEINLSFLSTGNLSKKFVKVGDEIKKGQILGELDYKSLVINRQEAQSNLDVARATLNKILTGATSYDIAIIEAQMNKANKAYSSATTNLSKVTRTVDESIAQAERSLADLESDGNDNITTYEQFVAGALVDLENAKIIYQKGIDDSVVSVVSTMDAKLVIANTALDEINSIINDSQLDDYLSSKNKYYLTRTRETYNQGLILFNQAFVDVSLAKEKKNLNDINKAYESVILVLNKTFDCLNYCYSALEASTIAEATLDGFKVLVNTQLNLVSGGVLAVENINQSLENAKIAYTTKVSDADDVLKQKEVSLDNATISAKNILASARVSGEEKIAMANASLNSAKNSLEVVRRELAKIKAPARVEDIVLYKAKVSQARASLDLINKRIEDSIIRSPIKGTVVKDEYEVGEQVLATKKAFSVLGENNFQIEVDISESDIAKIKKDQAVLITMDAFGEDLEFFGIVDFIEPAETVISEVIYYKVKIKFSKDNEEMSIIKSGMTANIIITTKEKEDVLIIPARTVIEKADREMSVRVLKEGREEQVKVETGFRGDGGLIEILAGIKAGDEIIISIKK